GVVFYETLTGQHAFNHRLEGDEALREIAFVAPPHAMRLNDAVPLGLNKVVMRLLEKDPAERYQHGDQLSDDLEALLDNVADESWEEPFQLPEYAPEASGYLTDIAARAEEPPTPRQAPEQTPLPGEAQVMPAAQAPVVTLPVPPPARSRL